MNQDQVSGKWEQLKGAAKKAWGDLTDDDFTRAEGSAEKLYGIIHEKFGDAKEAIHAKLSADEKAVKSKVRAPSSKTALRALFAVGAVWLVVRFIRSPPK